MEIVKVSIRRKSEREIHRILMLVFHETIILRIKFKHGFDSGTASEIYERREKKASCLLVKNGWQ